MKKLTAPDSEARSADLVAANLAKLKALFPELVTEGPQGASVNVDVLKQLVGDQTVTDAEEKYGLHWHGKRRARQLALTPSTGTLRPCPEESLDWDTTQNLMIEGDNLEVLKLLQKSYAGKVKIIYIDPPYNTGRDRVYPDDYQDSIQNYLALTGQVEGGVRVGANSESSGRRHTAWLSMLYPRLALSKSLLRPDGVIFVSIDDNEIPNLIGVMDEIFGPEQRVGTFIWRKKYTLSFRDEHMIPIHEYIIAYKGQGTLVLSDPRWDSEETVPVNPVFKSQNSSSTKIIRKGATLRGGGDLVIPAGSRALPSQSITLHSDAVFRGGILQGDVAITACFAVGQETLDTSSVELSAGGAAYIVDKESSRAICPISILFDYTKDDAAFCYAQYLARKSVSTRQATAELESLLEPGVFDNPKPVSLVDFLVSIVPCQDGAIVLDFFAGSGTTGHAVMARNSVDGGRRRFISVQLPEPLAPDRPDQKAAAMFCQVNGWPMNVAEITKERLRRASASIRAENALLTGDLGFRVFKLASSNIRAWDSPEGDLDQTLFDSIQHLRDDRTEADLLYELLLKKGLDLCVPIEKRSLAGKEVHCVGGGVLMACLADSIARNEVEVLALGIAEWHEHLAPAGEATCIFRDSAFEDDVAKSNLTAILEQRGIAHVQSL